VLQELAVEPFLSVPPSAHAHAGYYRIRDQLTEVLGLVGLAEKARRQGEVALRWSATPPDLGLGIVGKPESALFSTKPTTGFDPSARRGAWEVCPGADGRGDDGVLTTHYMDEAEALAIVSR